MSTIRGLRNHMLSLYHPPNSLAYSLMYSLTFFSILSALYFCSMGVFYPLCATLRLVLTKLCPVIIFLLLFIYSAFPSLHYLKPLTCLGLKPYSEIRHWAPAKLVPLIHTSIAFKDEGAGSLLLTSDPRKPYILLERYFRFWFLIIILRYCRI